MITALIVVYAVITAIFGLATFLTVLNEGYKTEVQFQKDLAFCFLWPLVLFGHLKKGIILFFKENLS